MVHLDYRDARPIYSQIIDGFRDQILAGVLSPGDKLPSVRELESQGWIQSVPGKGSFVLGVPQATAAETQALTEEFDKLTALLLKLGLTRRELMDRIEKGGNDHA